MHSIVALWSHPRSVSSAMERVMWERGDFTVFHEPFMYLYYVGDGKRAIPYFTPDPEHPTSYPDIRAMIYDAARRKPVFFKDMSYYVADCLREDEEFLHAVRSTFLIRDPARSIASYLELDPHVTCEEIGLEQQWNHFRLLVEKTGQVPIVIDAEDLQDRPEDTIRAYCAALDIPFIPESLTWGAELPASWHNVAGWHGDVRATRGILKPGDPTPSSGAEPRLQALYRHHRPFYEKLRAYRLRPGGDGA